jgi:hypothetical protein
MAETTDAPPQVCRRAGLVALNAGRGVPSAPQRIYDPGPFVAWRRQLWQTNGIAAALNAFSPTNNPL